MSSLALGHCMRQHCDAKTAEDDDAFCQACWKLLSRGQRTDLVRLRNDARRSKGATSKALVLAILRCAKSLDDQQAAAP